MFSHPKTVKIDFDEDISPRVALPAGRMLDSTAIDYRAPNFHYTEI